jgi:HEPN domain-containing protein
MKPHIEEAWRALRLADRDIKVFNILVEEPEAHLSIVLFHAQQAMEKSLKAVLFSRQIEFRRTHDLTELTHLLRQEGIETPVADDLLERMNPFPVTFRYDDMDIELSMTREDVAGPLVKVRKWAETQVSAAAQSGQGSGPENSRIPR